MSVNINVYAVPKNELYWKKEEYCDIAFKAENKYKKAKTEKTRNKWRHIFLNIIDIQRKFEMRLIEEFGYNY